MMVNLLSTWSRLINDEIVSYWLDRFYYLVKPTKSKIISCGVLKIDILSDYMIYFNLLFYSRSYDVN